MSLPKGQHYEYRVSWQWEFRGEIRQSFFADAVDAEAFARAINDLDRTPQSLGAATFLERRPVGEWEGP